MCKNRAFARTHVLASGSCLGLHKIVSILKMGRFGLHTDQVQTSSIAARI